MKLLILCLGFYLTSLSLAKAQDSSQTERKDSTAISDTTRMPDSLKAGTLQKDSLRLSDSAKKNHTVTTVPSAPSDKEQSTIKPAEAAPQDTIVDIFEEMKKAAQEQNRSMQEDAKKEKVTPPQKDSAISVEVGAATDSSDNSPDNKPSDNKTEAKAKRTPDPGISSSHGQRNADTTATGLVDAPANDRQGQQDLSDSVKQETAAQITAEPATAEKPIANKAADRRQTDTQTAVSSAQSSADSVANKTDDSTAVTNPVRDTIQSLFTLTPPQVAEQQQADNTKDSVQQQQQQYPETPGNKTPDSEVDSRVDYGADTATNVLSKKPANETNKADTTEPKAIPSTSPLSSAVPIGNMQNSGRSDQSEARNNVGDTMRQEQNAALNEIFTNVSKEKEKEKEREKTDTLQQSFSADSTIKPAAPNTSTTSTTAAESARPLTAVDSVGTKPNNADSVAKRLETGREGLDSTINSTQGTASGTPFTQLFEPYKKFRKNTSIESTTNLTILQQQVNYKTTADFSTRFQRTGQDGQNYLFDVSVVRLNTEVETMGVQLKYDSNTPTDSTSTFAKPLFDIVGKRTYLKVDSTGKITALDTSSLGQQVNNVLSGLSLSGGDYEVGSNFGLLLNNATDNLKVGQTWSDSAQQGDNQRVTTYKVQNLVDNEYIVLISGTVTQTGEIASDGLVFKTHFTGTQKGKMRVDKFTRLIKTKEITLDMKGNVDYQDNELPAAAISKIKENVTEE